MAAARRDAGARHRRRQHRLPGRRISLGRRAASAGHPARTRRSQSLYGLQPAGAAGHAALARSWPLGRAAPARAIRSADAGRQPLMRSCRPRARACTRFRSDRCMPASSSRDISASPASGETVVRLEERLGYVHKGIESLDGRRDARQGGAARRRASPATAPSPMRSLSRTRSRRRSISPPAARPLSARADGRARTSRQSFRRHRRDLQRRLLLAHARALRHPARTRAARRRRLFRPSPDDGPRSSRAA